MVEFVGKNRVTLANQRLNDANIRHVSGGKQKCGRFTDEDGQFTFQLVMHRAVAADQMRGARSHPMLLSPLLQRADELGMIGQTQIVVAAKGQIGFPVHRDMRCLGTLQHAPLTQQA